jgi:DDE superfamily endonuclease
VLADKGYTGADIGVHVPIKHQPDGPLHTDNRCYNSLIIALRAPTERGHALLGRWRALDRVTVCPQRIGVIAAAALVLTSLDRGSR